jgi:NAD-dependent SIR2 family protein deacetylase
MPFLRGARRAQGRDSVRALPAQVQGLMRNIVFILGAGASQESGGPLMWDFLDRAQEVGRDIARGNNGKEHPAFKLVFKAIAELQMAQAKSKLDIDNIESVFSAFEMAQLIGKLWTLSPEEIDELPKAIRQVIAITLERSINFDRSPGSRAQAPSHYVNFVARVKNISDWNNRCSFFTFNYDCALDMELEAQTYRQVDYGLGEKLNPGAVPLIKLHGSLNWFACSECNQITPTIGLAGRFEVETAPVHLRWEPHGPCVCNKALSNEPFIVPPTMNKFREYQGIQQVWKRAAELLHAAEYVYVIGYSYPPTDQFFEYLWALGTLGAARIKKFLVCDPNPDKVKNRFMTLLGQSAAARFEVCQEKFSGVGHLSFPYSG